MWIGVQKKTIVRHKLGINPPAMGLAKNMAPLKLNPLGMSKNDIYPQVWPFKIM